MHSPPLAVLEALGSRAEATRLAGGEGNSLRSVGLVFKAVSDVSTHEWASRLLELMQPVEFRISRPVRTRQGAFVQDGWSASVFEPGSHVRGRWPEKLQVAVAFHSSLAAIRTEPLTVADNPWSQAHDIVWQRSSVPVGIHLEIRTVVDSVLHALTRAQLGNGVVHSDLCGNVLFHDSLPPLVIDFSPTIAPVAYAHAILVVDAIAWEGAPLGLIDSLPATADRTAFLLRAVAFRLLVAALFYPGNPAKFREEYAPFHALLLRLQNR